MRHTDESDRLESCPAMLNVRTRVHSDASGLSTSVKVSEMLNSPAGSAKCTRGTTSGGDIVSAQHGWVQTVSRPLTNASSVFGAMEIHYEPRCVRGRWKET